MDSKHIKSVHFFNLYNNVQLRLYAYLMTLLHNSSDAEEVLQETAAILWEKFDQYQEGTNFGAWAIAVGRNKALQFLEKNKKTRQFFDDDFYDRVSEYAAHSTSDTNGRMQALNHCMSKIPEGGKNLLSMRFSKEVSYKKMSQLTGRTTNSLYQSIWKILHFLKKCIEKRLSYQDI